MTATLARSSPPSSPTHSAQSCDTRSGSFLRRVGEGDGRELGPRRVGGREESGRREDENRCRTPSPAARPPDVSGSRSASGPQAPVHPLEILEHETPLGGREATQLACRGERESQAVEKFLAGSP